MMPQHNRTIKQLALDEGIRETTLFNWRQEARSKGILMPDGDAGPEGWNARDKFAAVLESASLNEQETAESMPELIPISPTLLYRKTADGLLADLLIP